LPFLTSLPSLHPSTVVTIAAIGVLFTVSEIALINIPLRRDIHTVTLSEIPLTLGLFLIAPVALVLAAVAGSSVALYAHRRQRGVKLAFNVAQVGAQCVVATVVFRSALGPSAVPSARSYMAALIAAVAADFVSAALVTFAIRVYRGRSDGILRAWAIVFGVVASIAKTAIALVAVSVVVRDDWATLVPVIVTVACTFGALKAYAALVERHRRTEMLYRFTTAVGHAIRLEDIARAIVVEARELFRSSRSVLSLAYREGTGYTWSADVDSDEVVEIDGPSHAVATEDADTGARLKGALNLRGVYSAFLSVRDALSGSDFDTTDRRLFDALVAQASIALDAGLLFEELEREMQEREYRNTHDSVTGLPNSQRFVERVDERLAAAGEHAVLIISVDDFADIKETVGHEYANDVLRELAHRIVETCGDDTPVGYLIGEEFAILWPSGATTAICRTLSEVLTAEIVVDDLPINATVTIGCATSPHHATDGATLLRLADGALRRGRRRGEAVATYQPQAGDDARQRVTLAHGLRRALDRGDLVAYFQPKVDLSSGGVVGGEALVRWAPPEGGIVAPDMFIPIAEHTGLIDKITRFMLTATLAERRTWVDDGLDLSVAINVSARNLLDPKFAEDVMRALIRHECPAGALTLELTESQVMADPERAARPLQELHDIGVKIAVDDFGTGFSSLTLLRSLPIDELKIDKSFVLNVASSAADAAIVRSTVGLARNLGLACVAEGIEDRPALDFLLDLGVTIGQGYLFSKPLPAAEFRRWYAENLKFNTRQHAAEGI
jgi:diguanylate cyclase (GGDEF)-like protein